MDYYWLCKRKKATKTRIKNLGKSYKKWIQNFWWKRYKTDKYEANKRSRITRKRVLTKEKSKYGKLIVLLGRWCNGYFWIE